MSRFRLVKSRPWLGALFRPWIISNAYESAAFVLKHRRWPNFERTGYLNDLLFHIRATESDYVFRSFTADKEFAKIFVRGVTGEDLSVPTLAILRDVEAVDSYVFPDDCVIKPTHMSGEFIFHDTGSVSEKERARIRRWFGTNFADLTGERHYQNLEPKIIIEPWLKLNGDFCHDYRFHIFRDELTSIGIGLRFSPVDDQWLQLTPDWKLFPGRSLYSSQKASMPVDLEKLKPAQLERMIEISRQIGRHVEYVRVDFFTDGRERFYVGEISHVIAGARERFDPVELERLFTTSGSGIERRNVIDLEDGTTR